ncbi:myeloid leukemia factor 1-like [Halichondria panicea]|uniref:myeloid leukemia factor 1-like n=1 Tax=Halichondria panicea TaxID=6063 RepID=UPI00312B4FA8
MAFSHGQSMLESDPFFSGFPAFPEMGFPRHQALGDGGSRHLAHRRDPFTSMMSFGRDDPFARMHSMMTGMMHGGMQSGMMQSSPNGHCYSSSSVMHYSSGGNGGQPRVYHATSSTRQAGGIKETRKSVRDSDSGLQKMAIGHHINDRSHTIEKRINTKADTKEEHHELINVDEDDTHQFDQEWQKRSHQASIRLHPSHHSRTLPSLDMPTDRGHAHRHHPYGVPQHRRPPTSRLESLGSDLGPSAHGSGIGQPSKKHDSPLAGEQRRHKKVKGAMKKVHF